MTFFIIGENDVLFSEWCWKNSYILRIYKATISQFILELIPDGFRI